MGVVSALFAIAAAAIVAVWGWLGSTVQMPPSPLASGGKLYCISYAPFRGDQNPFGPDVPIDPRQIDEDLAQLKQITDCVRTYSIDHGLDQIPEIARRHGMKVLQGLWLSNQPDRSRHQVETAIALAKRFPDVIAAVIVGNEVLLRGEMSGPDLVRIIREVKAQVSMPVTYADVWEFWLRHREVAAAVDFVSIHILPYWEDFPIPARDAPSHVDAIRRRMVAAFPDKDILVGEFGWPSAGRMREGALPSPVNQARVMHEVLAHAERENYRVNLIEAYDQPWKRQLEGTVGGHWGIYDAYRRQAEIRLGWRGFQPSALALAGGGRRGARRRRFWRRIRRAPGHSGGGKCRRVAAYRGNCDRLRSLDRLDDRERTARKPHPGRLAALPRLGRRRFDGTGRERRRAGVGREAAEFCADSRPRGATPPRRDSACRSALFC